MLWGHLTNKENRQGQYRTYVKKYDYYNIQSKNGSLVILQLQQKKRDKPILEKEEKEKNLL